MDAIAWFAEPHPPRPERIAGTGRHDHPSVVVGGITESIDDFKLAGRAWANCRSNRDHKCAKSNSVFQDRKLSVWNADDDLPLRACDRRVGVLSVGRGCQGND